MKKIRLLRNKTQAELGNMVGLSDDRIRHYEQGKRNAKDYKLQEIADALEVNKYSIAEPNLQSNDGVMHMLFRLEDEHNLKLAHDGTKVVLYFDVDENSDNNINQLLQRWFKEYNKYCEEFKNQAEYDLWRYSFSETNCEE